MQCRPSMGIMGASLSNKILFWPLFHRSIALAIFDNWRSGREARIKEIRAHVISMLTSGIEISSCK